MKHKAGLAQLAEQESSKLKVGGSSPPLGTIISTALLSLALVLPGSAAAAKQSPQAEKSAQVSKAKAKKAARPQAKAKPSSKASSAKAKAKPEAATSSKKNQKSRSKAKAEPVESERPSKKSRGSRGKSAPVIEKRIATEAAAPVEPKRAVVLEKGETPVRTEQGCSGESGTLAPVGHVMKAAGKTFRCQKTWDYNDGKLVGYPAWVELFMPTPGWGAGLKETPRPPADAVPPAPGAKAKVAPSADKQPAVSEEDEAAADGVENQLY